MTAAVVFGLCGAAAAGLGLYGAIANPRPLRKILAFNLLSSGVFLLFGVIARRGAVSAFNGDPVPQALVITGIVVAAAGTALAVALLLRFFKATGSTTLSAGSLASIPADSMDK
jgi:multicomponent Na+:H+ antiporter subunit C